MDELLQTLKWAGTGANEPQVLLTKMSPWLQTQGSTELSVVAQKGMGIQRQVVGKQADVMGQQFRQALLHPSGHHPALVFPKKAMVHQKRICF